MPHLSKPFEGNYQVSAKRGWYNPFNKKVWHRGIDFKTPVGTPIYAIEDGTVIWSQWDSTGGGNMIKIKANSDGGETVFLHLNDRLVTVGQKVKRGELIAYSGATGKVTGPHLHFEFWKNVDPALAGLTVSGSTANFDNRWAEPSFWHNFNKPVITPQDENIFVTKKGGWRSEVINEIISAKIWNGTWQQNLDTFNRLNPITPQGGWKSGDKLVVKDATPVIPQPLQEYIPEAPTIIEVPKTQPQPEAISTPGEPPMPKITVEDVDLNTQQEIGKIQLEKDLHKIDYEKQITEIREKTSQNTKISQDQIQKGVGYFATKIVDRITSSRLWVAIGVPATISQTSQDYLYTVISALILGGLYILSEVWVRYNNNKK